jgi:Right handed beta helix region
MKKLINLVAGLLAAALLCVAFVSPSRAVTATTVYVSGGGNDANACSLTAPCRSISHAIAVIASGSTISCLDAGPYTETVNTSLSFTLDCRGVVYTSGSGFAISANAGITVRNAIFDGAAGGGGAASISGGGAVFENCTFQNFTASPGIGIQFGPSAAGAQLTITGSVFANNGIGTSGGGVVILPSAAITTGAVIERTQFVGNAYGIIASGNAGGTALLDVRYSTIASSVVDGIVANTTGSVASIVVEHSVSMRNGRNGINAVGSNAYVSLADSTVVWNATGLATSSGGLILSYQNNLIGGNPNPGVTPMSVSRQ